MFARSALGLLLLATSATATVDPPSSLRPQPRDAAVTFVHEHTAVVECTRRQATAVRCDARRRPADAATSLVLRRVPAGSSVRSGDSSRRVRVDIEPGCGPGARQVRLPTGVWSIEWPGAPSGSAFQIGGGERFAIQLRTTTGACRARPGRCEFVATQARSITIPSAHLQR